MAKSISTLLCLLFFSLGLVKPVQATHILGGEIMYQSDTTALANPLHYFFKLVIYQDGNTVADMPSSTLYFGDGIFRTSDRASKKLIESSCVAVYRSTYYFDYTFAGPGTYTVAYREINRDKQIQNIENAVDQAFVITAQITADAFEKVNTSPRFILPILPCAIQNQPFRHSLATTDLDKDSLVYELITLLSSTNSNSNDNFSVKNVTGYTLPQQVSLNSKTGEFIWDKPGLLGRYSFAVRVKKFRNNRIIGSTLRDFVVMVTPDPNNFTQVFTIENRSELSITDDNQISLTPGQPLELKVKYQTSGQATNLNAYSELYQWQPFTIDTTATTNSITAELTLNPEEAWRRSQPYILVFRGTSELNGVLAQQDFTITLVATPKLVSGGINPDPGEVAPDQKDLFVVYPNPAQNHFWVKNQKQLPRTRYVLYNALQQQILITELNKLNTRITLPTIANGIYFYQILAENGKVLQSGKLLIE
ncbi:T9SS type A sorting domain-containing protein [Adhaeribacter pallidiroseus]|uniref:Secretion system C-terminal sorting domain-containing protein n=1 Tax=Adhaeribacter pallidiroseus TaxID=2072847 RepID=A0A369QLI6_9BACT|nr:T9SS type A sorting domain-containing protein [Adhaeribacter pallidiroseus]RDC65210.1 hypothetical protein AHMF7616_03840 [Adhaeribacter pallidiroseus]